MLTIGRIANPSNILRNSRVFARSCLDAGLLGGRGEPYCSRFNGLRLGMPKQGWHGCFADSGLDIIMATGSSPRP